MSLTTVAYWPGDQNPASFQTLAYSPSTNTLSITPFGNSVVLNPTTLAVSTINVSTISANVINASTINSINQNSQTVNTSTINSQTINTSTINISTINGSPLYNYPAVNYVDPYGTSPLVSTVGNSSAAVPIITFSTIANHAYQVMVEIAATNGGGGGANDETAIGITNSNSSVGLYGRFIALDTWVTLQTYDAYRANITGIFNANSNNSGASVLELLNVSATGNVQVVSVEQFAVKDMGMPVNNF